jgi:hypothetical protein
MQVADMAGGHLLRSIKRALEPLRLPAVTRSCFLCRLLYNLGINSDDHPFLLSAGFRLRIKEAHKWQRI